MNTQATLTSALTTAYTTAMVAALNAEQAELAQAFANLRDAVDMEMLTDTQLLMLLTGTLSPSTACAMVAGECLDASEQARGEGEPEIAASFETQACNLEQADITFAREV